jgi:hypothetical protein
MSETRINAFPPHRRGLWRVKAEPYLWKDRWLEAPFGDRWRRIKARQRGSAPAPAARASEARV